jgi:hypothetical protein
LRGDTIDSVSFLHIQGLRATSKRDGVLHVALHGAAWSDSFGSSSIGSAFQNTSCSGDRCRPRQIPETRRKLRVRKPSPNKRNGLLSKFTKFGRARVALYGESPRLASQDTRAPWNLTSG